MANNYLDAMYEQAEGDYKRLALEQKKQVLKAYQTAGENLAVRLSRSKDGSATQAYYSSYIRSLHNEIKAITEETSLAGAELPVGMHKAMLTEAFKTTGIDKDIVKRFDTTFGKIPRDTLAKIVGGGIYADKKTLSDRLWGQALDAGADIQNVVMAGLANKTSAVALSKVLKEYVNPELRKTWDKDKIAEVFGDGYAGWNKNLEYNALRLARTTLTHSFQLSHLASCKTNPFVSAIRWHSAQAHGRTCDVCRARDGQIFQYNELPLDHPNGLCWQTAVITQSMDEIGDELANWIEGANVTKLDKTLPKGVIRISKPILKTSIKSVDDGARALLKQEGLTAEDIIRMSGQNELNGDIKYTITSHTNSIIVKANSEFVESGVKFMPDTKMIHFQSIAIKEGERGSGDVLRMFNSMTTEAKKSGYDTIKLHASRDHGNNGYYTWARYGFDGEIPDKIGALARKEFGKQTKLVSQLMETPEGRGWWMDNGKSVYLRFDLKDGSNSLKVLREYTNEKLGVQMPAIKNPIWKGYNVAVGAEPKITSLLQGVAKENGAELKGLDYRLKTSSSYKRKVDGDVFKAKEIGLPLTPEQASESIMDVIRYTTVADNATLVNTFDKTVAKLAGEGYDLVRVKNTFNVVESNYKGVNTLFRDKASGQVFELQFHTPQSLEVKEHGMHKLYEEWRLVTTTKERAKELDAMMYELGKQIKMPDNIDTIKQLNRID